MQPSVSITVADVRVAGETMSTPRKSRQTGVLRLRIDRELLELVKEKAKGPEHGRVHDVRWCILAGIVPGD